MAEQILPHLFRIEVPLPRSPLKALNAYVLTGGERFLVVDTGWNEEACLRAMLSGLDEIGVDLDRTDFFITHLHADHMGLVGRLLRKGTQVYLGKTDVDTVLSIRKGTEERVQVLIRRYLAQGYPEAELRKAVDGHPGFRFSSTVPFDLVPVREGDPLQRGEYSFRCIETPGHSPGHTCLYEPEKKILICGDHILCDITPNITSWPEMGDSLGCYLASLEKVYGLDADLVLPGHRSVIHDHRGRIRELREHHRRRLDEALRALESGEKTAWEVAPHLTWDLDVRSWDLFPPAQKWFAVGETVAHLKHLEKGGRVSGAQSRGVWMFSLTGS